MKSSTSDADEATAGSESTGGRDCIELNEGAGGEDCDATMCGPGEYCVGGGICEIGCRKTVTCAAHVRATRVRLRWFSLPGEAQRRLKS